MVGHRDLWSHFCAVVVLSTEVRGKAGVFARSDRGLERGLPLPFVSFGGSNLVSSMVIVGILLNISDHSRKHAEQTASANDKSAPGA